MNNEDFEAVNKLAMEQIVRLEKTGDLPPVEAPSALGKQRGSFWGSDYTSRYSPSSPSNGNQVPLLGSTPRTYYTSRTSYEYGSSSPDAFFRRTLNAIYKKAPEKEDVQQTVKVEEEEDMSKLSNLSFGSSMFGFSNEPVEQEKADNVVSMMNLRQNSPKLIKAAKPAVPKLASDTKNQMVAIVLSGVTRMATTMVVNWAKDKKVPYEIL